MLWALLGFSVVVLALTSAFHAILRTRTAQGAMAWLVALFSMPILAIPLYWLFGRRHFAGYTQSWRAHMDELRPLARVAQGNLEAFHVPEDARHPTYTGLQALAHGQVTRGNDIELLIDGEPTFASIVEGIAKATRYVLVEFYIVRDDGLGRRLRDALVERARAGVAVSFVYDEQGSSSLSKAYRRSLEEAGVRIVEFGTTRGWTNRFQVNFRNHRKIVVVDGETGFIGGLNVGDEYMGRSRKFGHWRDTHMRIDGPAVAQLQLAFAEDWHWATTETPELNWRPARHEGGRDCLILSTGPSDAVETGSLYFLNAINAASNRLWIATPYFVPDVDIVNALKLAALRGVDVRLLVPDKRDHWLVWLAAFSYFDEVRPAGVKVYRYLDGFMHSKTLVVDDWMGSVGTVNLDNRSCRLNFEATALVFDPGFADEIATMFEDDLEMSELYETDFNDIPHRLIRYTAPFARLFAPIL